MVSRQVDLSAAKACTERQLQLARTLRDRHGKGDAFLQLGALAQSSGEWNEAQHYYEQAITTPRALVLTLILTLTLTLTLARTLTLTLTRSRTRTLALPLTPGAARRRVACGHGGDQHRRVQHRAHPGQHGVRELHEQSHHLSSR